MANPDAEGIKGLLKQCVDHFDSEDAIVRERQLRHARRLKLYWNNFSQIYWSEAARDYRIYGSDDMSYDSNDQDYYDRPINVFRALLETIIAALSIQIPAISCSPDDADNPDDISTAKAGDKIAELIYKHNDVMFFWLYALYVHCTEGMVAAYTYAKEDKEYGEYQTREYEDNEIEAFVCPHCGEQLADDIFQKKLPFDNELGEIPPPNVELSEAEEFKFAPGDEDVDLHDVLNEEGPVCTSCLESLDPELKKTKLVIPKFVGMTSHPKSRICMEVKGMLYVKIPNYASTQKECLYLINSYETHYAKALDMYPKLRNELPKGGNSLSNAGVNDPYEQYARLNPQYRNAFPLEQVTIKNAWLRPSAFEILEPEHAKLLKKKFPDGAKVVLVNDFVVEFHNECMDSCWTITRNPMHDYLNHDALGELLTNVQDIVNDLISLTLQTIEQGIPQTWADPAVVNFEAQQQIEATPGYFTPTKAQGGSKNIGEAFHTTKAAVLSPEVLQFYNIINQLGQFVSAAQPSLFGGSQDSGSSRTASEYAMSRTASLQRLQTTWRMFSIWWKNIFGKAIPAYMKIIKEQGDERVVKKSEQGNFVNTIIRRAELSGKLGNVEVENGDTIPISDEQKADLILKLMEVNNQEIMSALITPANLPFIRKVVKMPEFKLPGEDDRQKQFEEINQLVNSEPIVMEPDLTPEMQAAAMAGNEIPVQPPTELPSVEVDPDVDNHIVEAEICRSWLISDAGRLCKQENPAGYKNVLLHMKQHMQFAAEEALQQQSLVPEQETTPNNKGNSPAKPKQEQNIRKGSDAINPIG